MARSAATPTLPDALLLDIERAGYLPSLVRDIIGTALGSEEIVSHVVHQETTFDEQAVRQHLTVLCLTDHRLIIAHADDHESAEMDRQRMATATTETVPLSSVRGVMLTHVVPRPEEFAGGTNDRAVTLTLAWGAVARMDLVPAVCADPNCEGDHGYEGTVASDDIALRISSDVDGPEAVAAALEFSQQLSGRLGR